MVENVELEVFSPCVRCLLLWLEEKGEENNFG